LRDYHLCKALGSRSDLTYVFYAQQGAALPNLQDLPFCRRIIPIPAPRRYTPLKVMRGLIGRWPITVHNYTSSKLNSAVLDLLRKERFSFLHLDSIHMAGCAEAVHNELENIPVFYNWHNIESELMYRYAEQAPLLRQHYARLTARRLESAEDRILNTASGHVVCSERERVFLEKRNSQARLAVIENGVDTAAYRESAPSTSARRRLLFVGSMNYHANIEGALWFTRSIWPSLRQRFPNLKLTLVGADPAPAVLNLRSEPAVEVTGTVPDVRPYYHDALAAIVPLRTGSGTRLKILEAMAAGVPVISTRIGAEGLQVTPDKDILLAEQQQEWQASLSTLQQPDRWKEVAQAAREYVSRHDWEVLGGKLFDTYSQWLESSR
jgi:glycosyltransferase involved in cell wall biosynthesis